MRLVYIFAAILAVSVAETSDQKMYEDLVAMETMELKKESADLTPAASAYSYVPPSQRPPHWNPNQNYVPAQTWTPPQADPIQPIHTHVPSVPVNPPYVPAPVNPPQYPSVPVNPPYVPPVTASPPYMPPQNDYYPQPIYHPTTTTPVAVIKNEQYFGENGSYKYEYQIADGTHVGEEGYYTDPKGTDESLVKKGWYSFKGGDGKIYTVTYWADHTGFHAYGDHLPTPPPPHQAQPVTFAPTTQKPYNPHQHYPQQTYPPHHQYPQPTYPPQHYPQQSGYGK